MMHLILKIHILNEIMLFFMQQYGFDIFPPLLIESNQFTCLLSCENKKPKNR